MAVLNNLRNLFTGKKHHAVKVKNYREHVIYSPLQGELVEIGTVDDPSFANLILGPGLAVRPEKGELYAPVKGKISVLFETKHAIGITTDAGEEVLIHIGIDTVALKGEGFKARVSAGDHVEAGQLLMEFDPKHIVASGYDPVTMIVVTNRTSGQIDIMKKGSVKCTEEIAIIK